MITALYIVGIWIHVAQVVWTFNKYSGKQCPLYVLDVLRAFALVLCWPVVFFVCLWVGYRECCT